LPGSGRVGGPARRKDPLRSLEHLQPAVTVYLRVALGAAFLSAVADRFGLWGPFGTPNVAWGEFGRFVAYVGKLNWFVPEGLWPLAAWLSTAAELALGLLLLVGLWTRVAATLSALLLLVFALAMTVALGPEAPLAFSVWSASAGAALLAALPEPAYVRGLDHWLHRDRPRRESAALGQVAS
jgi:uncharacterized membrane protein YphA (DoxX/SURF4 family)